MSTQDNDRPLRIPVTITGFTVTREFLKAEDGSAESGKIHAKVEIEDLNGVVYQLDVPVEFVSAIALQYLERLDKETEDERVSVGEIGEGSR